MQENTVWGSSEDGSIEYVQMTKELLQQSLDVMHKSFYINENVCVALGLSDHPECFPEMDAMVRGVAKNGISIAAVDKTSDGKVVGVSFNKLQGSGHGDFYLKHIKSSRFSESRNVMQWMQDVEKMFNIFEHCKVESGMEIMFVSILPEYRKRGIAKKLFQVSIEVARYMKEAKDVRISIDDEALEITRPPEIVSAICTTFVTQKIANTLGLEIATRIGFDKFLYDGISLQSRIPSHSRDLTYEYIRL